MLNNCVSGAVFSPFAHSMRASSINIFGVAVSPLSSIVQMKLPAKRSRGKKKQKFTFCKYVCWRCHCWLASTTTDFNGQRAEKKVVPITLLAHTTRHRAWLKQPALTHSLRRWNPLRFLFWCLMQAHYPEAANNVCGSDFFFVPAHFCRSRRIDDAIYFREYAPNRTATTINTLKYEQWPQRTYQRTNEGNEILSECVCAGGRCIVWMEVEAKSGSALDIVSYLM